MMSSPQNRYFTLLIPSRVASIFVCRRVHSSPTKAPVHWASTFRMSLSFTTSSLSSSRSIRMASVYSFCRSKAWAEPQVSPHERWWAVISDVQSTKRKSQSHAQEKRNCEKRHRHRGLDSRTPIFLSFHSTVSWRSDISLTKPSCFIFSWRISWTAWEAQVWAGEIIVAHAFVESMKLELWIESCSL